MERPCNDIEDMKRRYTLAIQKPLYDELTRVAEELNMSVVDVLRRFIRLGLYVTKIEKSPNEELCILRDGRPAEKIVLI